MARVGGCRPRSARARHASPARRRPPLAEQPRPLKKKKKKKKKGKKIETDSFSPPAGPNPPRLGPHKKIYQKYQKKTGDANRSVRAQSQSGQGPHTPRFRLFSFFDLFRFSGFSPSGPARGSPLPPSLPPSLGLRPASGFSQGAEGGPPPQKNKARPPLPSLPSFSSPWTPPRPIDTET